MARSNKQTVADYIIIARSCAMRIGRFFDCLEDKENTIRFYITSDILGGSNYGLDTCWINFDKKTHTLPTYCCDSFKKILEILN